MSQRVFVRNLGGTPIVVNALEVGDAVTGGRETLEANRTYYVRTGGSDSNVGYGADNDATAFLTIQHAINEAVSLDLSIYAVTIQIQDAVWTESLVLKSYIGVGPITLQGNSSAVPAAGTYSLNSTGTCIQASGVNGEWIVSGVEIKSSATWGLYADYSSLIRVKNLRFGACALAQVVVFTDGKITNEINAAFSANFAISGNALWWLLASQAGYIAFQNTTVTLTGTPAFSQSTVSAGSNSLMDAASITFVGSATGTRFAVSNGAVIGTNGGGANYFPGNAAGTGTTFGVSPYGLYV